MQNLKIKLIKKAMGNRYKKFQINNLIDKKKTLIINIYSHFA